jgi:hypothetical protein
LPPKILFDAKYMPLSMAFSKEAKNFPCYADRPPRRFDLLEILYCGEGHVERPRLWQRDKARSRPDHPQSYQQPPQFGC